MVVLTEPDIVEGAISSLVIHGLTPERRSTDGAAE
jgi:hypothetical protein